MIHLMCYLTNLLFFDIPVLYCYTNLNSSIICCLSSRDMYILFGASISLSASLFFECKSDGDFLKRLIFYQQFCYELNHQLLLLFYIARFEAVFVGSVVDFLALSRSFWPYLLLNFYLCFSQMTKIHILLHILISRFNWISHFYMLKLRLVDILFYY